MNVLSDGRGTHYGTFSVLGCSKETHGNTMELKLERWDGIVCVYVCEWECDEFTIKKYLLNCRAGVRVFFLGVCSWAQLSFLCEDARLDWKLSGSDFSRFFFFFRAEPQLLIISCRKPHFKGASLSPGALRHSPGSYSAAESRRRGVLVQSTRGALSTVSSLFFEFILQWLMTFADVLDVHFIAPWGPIYSTCQQKRRRRAVGLNSRIISALKSKLK